VTKKTVSRRKALRLLTLAAAASLAACRGIGNSATPSDAVVKDQQPQASRASETATPTATQPASPTIAPTSVVRQFENQATATPQTGSARPTSTGNKVLLVYFSRAGENYYYGGRINLEVGNTEVLAGMISQRIGCDVHRIEAADPYPYDYEETRERNVREQEANARPAIANPLASIASYDTVLLGSPIWNVRAPMIMTTFVEGFDFTGKTVVPFVTYAVSGLGTTMRDYAASCPGAAIGEGLSVRGEEVRDAGAAVETWLRKINLLS
jgi:flavodoxin